MSSHFDDAERPPAADLIGRELVSVDPDTREVRMQYTARPEFTNRHGTVGGGFLAAMLDSVCGSAAFAVLGDEETVITRELHVSFRRPASVGPVVGRGRVSRREGDELTAEGELLDADDTVLASGVATFRVVARPSAATSPAGSAEGS